jgi:hypothetical protein
MLIKEESITLKKKLIIFITFILCLACFSSVSQGALASDTSYWEIKVIAEKAKVRVERDLKSPAAATLSRGSILKSYEKAGEWFRVIVTDEIGFAVIGYLHSIDVEVLREKKSSGMGFWEEESGPFEGLNISIKFTIGLNYFSGGDISKGTQGIYDSTAAYISSFGLEEFRKFKPFHIGYEISGDIIYHITPNLGVGLGSGFFFSGNKSTAYFHSYDDVDTMFFGNASYLDSTPKIEAVPIRLGIYLTLPLDKTFNLCLNTGPSLYLINYTYILRSEPPYYQATIHEAKSHGFGVQGGIGIDFKLNSRTIFFIQGQGRYAKITNLRGNILEKNFYSLNEFGEPPSTKVEGVFYYLTGNEYPSLTIFDEDTPINDRARKAVFDFSGFIIQTGISVKF